MEIFELKYFFEVAKQENIHRASERLRISPAAISKAIARLEAELDVVLFHREGRGIRLSNEGSFLKARATEIIALEEKTKFDITGQEGRVHAILCGPEMLLSAVGVEILKNVQQKNKDAHFEFISVDDKKAIDKVESGEAHLALSTFDAPAGLRTKTLGETKFLTVVGQKHPLASKSKDPVPVEKLLEYPFVSTVNPIFGKVGIKQSHDGWRDDEFPRKINFLTTSLILMIQLVEEGRAVAYLPEYLVGRLKGVALKVKGCPYTCVQKIKLVARRPEERSWMKELFMGSNFF